MPTPPRDGLRPLILASALIVASCADDPRVARRASAIDLAGAWVEVRDDEAAAARVTIANEVDFNDVVVTIDGRVINADEAGLIDRVVDDTVQLALRSTLGLGAGRDAVLEETDGGENVSFDLGETSTLQVVSDPIAVTPTSPTTTAATVTWSLRLVGTAEALTGSVSAHVAEREVRPGDVDGATLVTTTMSVPMRLVR